MHSSHYCITRARSRSPSPAPGARHRTDEGQQNVAFQRGDCDDKSGGDQRLRPESHSSSDLNKTQTHDVAINAVQHDLRESTELIKEPIKSHRSRSCGNMLNEPRARSYGSMSHNVVDMSHGDNSGHRHSATDCERSHPRSPRLKRQKSYYTPDLVDDIRKRNKLYFLDPITKLRYFHGFPWKLTLQVIKVILITAQIIIFGGQRESIVEFFERSTTAYENLLLKDWDPSYETMPYPPASGPYAVYDMHKLFDHIDYFTEKYYRLPEMSLATVSLIKDNITKEPVPIELCFRANLYKEYSNGTYIVSADIMHNCTQIHRFGSPGNWTYDIQKYLKETNFTLPFNRTIDITVTFKIKAFHLNLLQTHYGPTCYNVTVQVDYTNVERSGQILIGLSTTPVEIDCKGKILSEQVESEMASMKTKVTVFDAFVIAACCLSVILCSRSLHRCNTLRRDTARFFKLQRGQPFSLSNHMEYINGWYILIICNDILTVVGSSFKIQLESRVFSISSENYEICSILLGLGILFTYCGILRYLGFFKSYNVLILTMKTSFPHVLRFLVCAICLYIGFLFCGWVVFSPYHIKFRKLSTASECLYSLVNGDDMFVTFSALTSKSDAIWYFHRAYLYIFISLFIYVVLSVFIAVIMDNYENLKNYYEKGYIETEVQKFIREDGDVPASELFSHVRRDNKFQSWFFCIFPCLSCLRRAVPQRDRSELLATI